jgi:hypothetical protein
MKFESEPLNFENWRRLSWMGIDWLQDAGGFAMVGLVLWILNAFVNPVYDLLPDGRKRNRLIGSGMMLFAGIALCLYLVALGLNFLVAGEHQATPRSEFLGIPMTPMARALEIALAVAGLAAIVGFAGPFVADCFRMRWGRIYALAKLSFKEAVRRRVVWVFLSILVLYLFPARWFFQEKPEDEIKSIVGVTTRGMNVLLISVGLLLAAFSIPNDIKNLTIHTIVTKPVEKFEIVLGRFFGYLGLITAALVVMTGFGLVLINAGNVSPEAQEESMKARVARYGNLEFARYVNRRLVLSEEFQGVDVGREDVYRKYIAGHQLSTQRAVWTFSSVPDRFGEMDSVPLEFAFDIYRTTKGEEGTGVQVTFELLTHNWGPTKRIDDPQNPGTQISMQDGYDRDIKGLTNVQPGTANWAKVNEVAERYGRYEYKNWQIFDYHTSTIPVPAGLFRNAASGTPDRDGMIQAGPTQPARRLAVLVKCETPSQFVGVARYDLYLLESEGNFSLNYFKGSVGLWFRVVIALAIAIALSTYLSGVLSFLTAMFLFIGGFFLDYIQELARGLNVGGGPMESLARLVEGKPMAVELDATPMVKTLQMFDGGYRWVLRRVMNVIPDVDRYGLSDYVAQGFSIGPDFLVLNLITLVGYVIPWLIAAYYLMKAREIAA